MKKWGEIKQATLDKLFMTQKEAEQQDYLSKFESYANEALDAIANGVKPRVVEFKFNAYESKVVGTEFRLIEVGLIEYVDEHYNEHQIVADNKTLYYVDEYEQYAYSNGKLLKINGCLVGEPIYMPEDFLSFTDMLVLRNKQPYSDIIYVSDSGVVVNDMGEYVICYNALWQHITLPSLGEGVDDVVIQAPPSVVRCLPSYIAAQVLAQDDIQRSVMLKNDFELMLSRLDTNIMYQSNSFKSSGGWY